MTRSPLRPGRRNTNLRTRLRQRFNRLVRPAWLGTLRRTTPLSAHWGFERGTPIDRCYIEQFLQQHCADLRGAGLEVKDRTYLDRFGTALTRVDILDIDPANPAATICADLSDATAVPSDQFDCIIVTQTLQFVFDLSSAIGHLHRMLRPGGVLLVTVPSVTRVDRHLQASDYWRFTVASCRELFGAQFGAAQVEVSAYGNVLTAMAFLTGMAGEELTARELASEDELFPVVIAVRAVKRGARPAPEPTR